MSNPFADLDESEFLADSARARASRLSARVLAVASDPKAAATAYGQRTGSCSCCGRELTNKESIDLGTGQMCAGKFGW